MNFFFKRYVVDFILFAILGVLAWAGAVWFFEDYIPWIVGALVVVFLISYIPYMVKQDYNKVKEIYLDYNKMKSNEISKETFHRNLIMKISDEVGIPEFVSEKILNKVIKEKPVSEVTSSTSV